MRRLILLSVILAALAATSTSPVQASIPFCPWAMGPAASGPRPKPIGTITIGAINLRTPVYRGLSMKGMANATDPGLTYGPAVYPKGKSFGKLPSQGRVIGIAGHRTTRLHPFCLLNRIRIGKYVTLTLGKRVYIYRVVFVDRWANPNSWKYFKHPERFDKTRQLSRAKRFKYLVMGACTPPRYATYRINVVARLVGTRPAK